MRKVNRHNSKWVKYSIGAVILVVGGICIWHSIDIYNEVQQIESKLDFDIKIIDRQSHDTWWSASRTYRVKASDNDNENNIEYLLYLNKENKIEQWAKIENGKIIQSINYEENN